MSRGALKDLNSMFEEGVNEGAEFMVIVCDEFSSEDFPVFVGGTYRDPLADQHHGTTVHEVVRHYMAQPMHTVMEVYSLKSDQAAQMAEYRAWHLREF